jgi:hypothetical protein
MIKDVESDVVSKSTSSSYEQCASYIAADLAFLGDALQHSWQTPHCGSADHLLVDSMAKARFSNTA